jgi:hypothetical protein
MNHLRKNDSDGYKEFPGPPVDPSGGPLRPWALTPDGRVVYSEWKPQHDGIGGILELTLGKMHGKSLLRTYDKAASQMRRREFETKLAEDAAAHPMCAMPAVNMVTNGLKAYLVDRARELDLTGKPSVWEQGGECVKNRCFSNSGSGRLGTKSDANNLSNISALKMALQALEGTDIQKILGIQVAFANTLSKTLGFNAPQRQIHTHTANQVAPSQGYLYKWFDQTQGTPTDNLLRGRAKGATPPLTTAPGLMPSGDGGELRERGSDLWGRAEGTKFVSALDSRNLIFGAGRSGTTGELLKTYRVFGGTDSGESFKQYLLAIVVYIVGGGHHSCHEIFSVANLLVGSNGPRGTRSYASVSTLVKDAYVPGKYIKHLPDSYLNTPHFTALAEKYYDIAYLGHLHGTYV